MTSKIGSRINHKILSKNHDTKKPPIPNSNTIPRDIQLKNNTLPAQTSCLYEIGLHTPRVLHTCAKSRACGPYAARIVFPLWDHRRLHLHVVIVRQVMPRRCLRVRARKWSGSRARDKRSLVQGYIYALSVSLPLFECGGKERSVDAQRVYMCSWKAGARVSFRTVQDRDTVIRVWRALGCKEVG